MSQSGNLKSEKRILRISFIVSTAFLGCEILAAILTRSQAVLIDSLYDLADLLMLLPLMMLVPKLYKPESERWPYGLSQLEPLFVVIRCTVLLVMDFFLMKDCIEMIIAGGHIINAHAVAGFEFSMAVGCVIMYIILRLMCRKYMTPAMESELYVWKVDAYSTAGVGLAFLIQILVEDTRLDWLTPYIDPGIAVVMAVILLWEPVTMIYEAIRNLILAAPKEEVRDEIREIIDADLKKFRIKIDFLEIVKTGRRIWVEVYILPPDNILNMMVMKTVQVETMNRLNGILEEDVFVEIVPELSNIKTIDGEKQEDCKRPNDSKFFCNKDCEFFPCHPADDTDNFNCLFCYCPLYALGDKCGGNFRFTEDGVKDCSDCTYPHQPDTYDYILGKWDEIKKTTQLK